MRTAEPVIDMLRTVPGLSTAAVRELTPLVPLFDQYQFDPGAMLAREGTVARQAFVVVEGTASVSVRGETISSIGPGQFVGEMALLDNSLRCATVQADTAMRVLVIGPAAFPTFVNHRHVARAMARQLAQQLRRADEAVAL